MKEPSTNCTAEVAGIAYLGDSIGEFGKKFLLASSVQDVVHKVLCLFQISDDEIGVCKGCCCNGLLMGILSMNDGRVLLFTLIVHCIPDLRQHSQLHAVRGNARTPRQHPLLERQAQVMCLQLVRSFALITGKSSCLAD